jgi:hypothetical protein
MKRQARLALAAFTIATLAFIAGRETAEGAYFDWGAGPLHWARTDTAEELRIAVYHDGVTTPEALVDAAAHLSTLAGVDVFVAGAAPPSVCEQYTQDFADYWVNPTTPGVITWCGGKSTNGHCGACTELYVSENPHIDAVRIVSTGESFRVDAAIHELKHALGLADHTSAYMTSQERSQLEALYAHAHGGTSTPTPTPTPTVTESATSTPTATASPSPTPTPTPRPGCWPPKAKRCR